jgi:cytochrome d ubiquinol oxidase subunit I
MENIDIGLVDWSRAQFALTAMYHWIFVPLTLGLAFIIAIMETIYVRTGKEEWKKITKFWMKLFGINFAIGVATGIILEFEFGTNWSNYSWFVGDIFGAPLAVEGIMAFFMESTFIAIMFFGWKKVSKKMHLISTWLVAFGANLSALWILVANAWMQNPVGMKFNPDTARNEMDNFWEVLLSPTAINKFLHTITSGYVLAAIFVVGISAWFLLKKREIIFAKKSMVIAATFGLLSTAFLVLSGDESARHMAKIQPMKFAAMEALYDGKTNAPLIAIGILEKPQDPDNPHPREFYYKIEIPNALSYLAFLSPRAFVPGINDLVNGNPKQGIASIYDKIKIGKIAIKALKNYKQAKKDNDIELAKKNLQLFEANYKYFGYGYYDNANDLIPSVPLTFYSFHIMVILGLHFGILFIVILILLYKKKLERARWVLWISLWTIPLVYIASQCGWIVAELGRQPWVVQDLMPTLSAVSQIDKTSVQITFWLFAVVFTALLIAEIKIMTTQIKKGPKDGGQ